MFSGELTARKNRVEPRGDAKIKPSHDYRTPHIDRQSRCSEMGWAADRSALSTGVESASPRPSGWRRPRRDARLTPAGPLLPSDTDDLLRSVSDDLLRSVVAQGLCGQMRQIRLSLRDLSH